MDQRTAELGSSAAVVRRSRSKFTMLPGQPPCLRASSAFGWHSVDFTSSVPASVDSVAAHEHQVLGAASLGVMCTCRRVAIPMDQPAFIEGAIAMLEHPD
eukprot:6483284-Alexandrium_andersonii.AAC.1